MFQSSGNHRTEGAYVRYLPPYGILNLDSILLENFATLSAERGRPSMPAVMDRIDWNWSS